MKSSVLVSVVALVGIVACGDSGSSSTAGGGGSGGSGASGSTESTGGTTNTAGNGTGANGEGGTGAVLDAGPGPGPGPGAGGASACSDIATCQDGDQDPSNDCVSCAVTSVCSDQYTACTQNADCVAINTCLTNCSVDDPNCPQACAEANAAGIALYQEVILCAVCDTCYDSCDGAMAGCP